MQVVHNFLARACTAYDSDSTGQEGFEGTDNFELCY